MTNSQSKIKAFCWRWQICLPRCGMKVGISLHCSQVDAKLQIYYKCFSSDKYISSTGFIYLETILRVMPGGTGVLNRLVPAWENRGVSFSEQASHVAASYGAARLENEMRAKLEPATGKQRTPYWTVIGNFRQACKL